ncbi:winged helix-turn-helix domain-containing protein [Fervidicoccus fontis]|nr:winged helix-turn-helix domain-containing protein [Fervidicoccus fontis]
MSNETEEERKYRSDTEILYEIMNVISSGGDFGIKKTHLMYKTNLNSKMLQKYLDILQRNGLIIEENKGKQKIIKMTPKGKSAYFSLKMFSSYLNIVQTPQEIVEIYERLRGLKGENVNINYNSMLLGKSGIEYAALVVITKEKDRYVVGHVLSKNKLDMVVDLMQYIIMMLDTNSKIILIVSDESISKIIPEKLENDIKIIPLEPKENLIERIRNSIKI